jgi:quinol monooxygenase YgiN
MQRRTAMVTVGLLVRMLAKPTKENEVAQFLEDTLEVVRDEPSTTAWFGIRFSVLEFGIFDVFPDEEGRRAHLTGRVAQALKENEYLFEETPSIETADVLAAKLPGG